MVTQFFIYFLLIISCYVLTIKALDNTGFVGSLDPKSLGLDKTKSLSHFRFYWHEFLSGNNATNVAVVPPLPKYNTTTSFGTIGVFDNVLTVGPGSNSTVVGRVEGVYAATSQTVFSLTGIRNFVLTQGKYNGSIITFVGRNPIFQKVREQPVVGGTGVFRFATGFVESTTLSQDPQTNNNVIEFNVYVYTSADLGFHDGLLTTVA